MSCCWCSISANIIKISQRHYSFATSAIFIHNSIFIFFLSPFFRVVWQMEKHLLQLWKIEFQRIVLFSVCLFFVKAKIALVTIKTTVICLLAVEFITRMGCSDSCSNWVYAFSVLINMQFSVDGYCQLSDSKWSQHETILCWQQSGFVWACEISESQLSHEKNFDDDQWSAVND